MGKIIIGIHGLSNKPEAKVLSEDWKKALLEGLRKNAKIEKDSIPFELVYWANVMHKPPLPNAEYREAKPGSLKRYEEGWRDYLRERVSTFGGNVLDTLEQIKQMYGIDNAADEALKLALNDLHQYYHVAEKRNQLRKLLKEALLANQDKRIMLIAHSMGCIIAYDVLHELGQETKSVSIDHWVTLGCPLGLPHVKFQNVEKEYSTNRTPSNVKQWTNLADRRDFVALDTHLRDDYQANIDKIRVNDYLVANDWGLELYKETQVVPYHAIYGYLRTPEFTDIVRSFV